MKLIEVSPDSPEFSAVIKLWRRESATLGYMPRGGFEAMARAGGLLAAVNSDDGASVAGYLAYHRTAKGVVVLVHLCVDPNCRRTGVALHLVDALKSRCADCLYIRLRCRRDFEAAALWPKVGFVAVRDMPARSANRILTEWRYEVGGLPLLRLMEATAPRSGAARVAIDANVFFDLDELSAGDQEPMALRADWLEDYVELAVTAELFNEIDRRASAADRARQRARAARFVQLPRDVAREEAVLRGVRDLLPQSEKPSTESDARQLAMAIAARVTYFVTRDGELLDAADALNERFDIDVISPHQVIRRFDELRRGEDYRPRRLFLGPGVLSVAARADDVSEFADLMHFGQLRPEPRRQTVSRLREMLAQPERFEATRISENGAGLAVYILDRDKPGCLAVPFFAVADSQLGKTAARHYAEWFVAIAAQEGRRLVRVDRAGSRIGEALAEVGFFEEEGGWVKFAVSAALPPDGIAAEVERIAAISPDAAPLAERLSGELRRMSVPGITRARAAQVERALWPAKLLDVGLPCFIVPIQPRWAKDLFDRELARGTLFGATPGPVLNCENVYYRAARPRVLSAPARVLWYVSADAKYPQAMALRACSLIDAVVIGKPKELFGRFKRLGVYGWRDVFTLAKDDLNRDIMAFRFSRTELLSSPIGGKALRSILKDRTGKNASLQSPLAISEDCFLALYAQGIRRAAA